MHKFQLYILIYFYVCFHQMHICLGIAATQINIENIFITPESSVMTLSNH